MIKSLLIIILALTCAYLWVDGIDAELQAQRLKRKSQESAATCEQAAVSQCLNYWFTGDPTDKAIQRRRICGGKH